MRCGERSGEVRGRPLTGGAGVAEGAPVVAVKTSSGVGDSISSKLPMVTSFGSTKKEETFIASEPFEPLSELPSNEIERDLLLAEVDYG